MLGSGASRKRIARTLNAAYANGLLSEETFTYRLDRVLGDRLIDPGRLIGDLSFRPGASWPTRMLAAAAALRRSLGGSSQVEAVVQEMLLALDWTGATTELLVGRHRGCDVVLDEPTVSRRHARLFLRDGGWVLQDLQSTNGTLVNGTPVGRCGLRPGDRLTLGHARLRID